MNVHSDSPLQIYTDEFETTYLKETASYYASESMKLISTITTSNYIKKVSILFLFFDD